MPRGRPRKNPKPEDNMYFVNIDVGGVKDRFWGKSIEEAFKGKELPKVVAKTVLTVEKGDKKYVKQYWPFKFKRLFTNSFDRVILQKNADLFMK